MVTKRPTTTLLNKFTHLFRRSGSDNAGSADAGLSTRSPMPAESADSLKKLFKSKRRNDAMRVYELNHLRTIIRSGRGRGMQSHTLLEAALATPQTRNSGMGSLERSSLLKKIDGAEAHLEQWWGSGSGHAALSQTPIAPAAATGSTLPDTAEDLDLDFTGMSGLGADSSLIRYPASGPVPFTDDEMALTPVDNGLRDAALLYAEGEFDAAESTLSMLLLDPALDSDATELLTFALFDVYRCAGLQERFDALALDYAGRFGRSPAEWFSYGDQALPLASVEQANQAMAQATTQRAFWMCPALLDAQALADCAAHPRDNSQICAIDWFALQHIDPVTATAFARQIATWCEKSENLQWLGVDCLMDALQMCRVSGKVPENEPWWLVELDMLCLLQQPQAFEELALEYCVAFEVSPPSWKPVACKLVHVGDAPEAVEFVATVPSLSFDSDTPGQPEYATYELHGNVTGHNPPALHGLRYASRSARQINVSCPRLGRIDINAAATLLNWAQECYERGCSVQFLFLPRLVQVYFHMLGMDKLASM
jgi:ABC-type transporter Mla MlaB component